MPSRQESKNNALPPPALDLVSIQYALLVEEQGSFRLASKILQVRPSVVSRRVRALEDTLGVSLFNRTNKGIHATLAGAQALSKGRTILTDIDLLLQTARVTGRGQEGRLRFGVVTSIASGFARQLLAFFAASHPEVRLEVAEGSPRESAAAVRTLTLDFAFVIGRPMTPGCEVETFWHERVFVALPDRHPLCANTEIAWDQLAQEHFIVTRGDAGPEIQDYITRALADLGRHPEVEKVSTQRETLLALVGLGQGLSLVGEGEASVFYPGVTFRPLDHEELPFSIVWSEQNDNPAFRRFLSGSRLLANERQRGRSPP